MSVEIILGGIGTALGIANFVYWAWWARREKVEVKINSLVYRVDDAKNAADRCDEIKIYWNGEFRRSGTKDVRYIVEVWLKPDPKMYGELKRYFALPPEGVIKIKDRWELPKNKIVSSRFHDGVIIPDDDIIRYPVYNAIIQAKDTEEWKFSEQLASALAKKTIEIGLVWDDSRKTHWKTIPKERFGEWV